MHAGLLAELDTLNNDGLLPPKGALRELGILMTESTLVRFGFLPDCGTLSGIG